MYHKKLFGFEIKKNYETLKFKKKLKIWGGFFDIFFFLLDKEEK